MAETPRIAAVVLAAGAGTRLRPLTLLRPKALCPVGNVALVDCAIARARTITDAVAVNVHHGRDQMLEHLGDRVHVSIEEGEALGTAGALGYLRDWIDGRDVLVMNADAWHDAPVEEFVAGWERTDPRLWVVPDAEHRDFGDRRFTGTSLLPWSGVATLPATPAGLYEVCFREREAAGRLELVDSPGPYFDCGTVAEYHAANMAASNGENVVGERAVVEGEIVRTVVWPDSTVRADERLVDAVRAGTATTVYANEGGTRGR